MGRPHFYWTDGQGGSWEFYKKGSSRRTYWQNSLYVGEIKRMTCAKCGRSAVGKVDGVPLCERKQCCDWKLVRLARGVR